MLWEELRQDEFSAAVEKSSKVCVLPIGCVEAHAIHLPLGCDVMHVMHHCILASEMEPIVIFPPIYFGEKSGAGEYPGTIIFPESLIMKILDACCEEIHRNGFDKILIVNGHGGNPDMLKTFICSTLDRKRGYIVYLYSASLAASHPSKILESAEDFPYLTDSDKAILEGYVSGEHRDGHGGFIETGWIYAARPELTRLDLMNVYDGRTTGVWSEFSAREIYTPFGWMANFPHSLSCTPYEGLNERIANAMAELSAKKLANVFCFLKRETTSVEFYKAWEKKNPTL